MRFEVTTRVVYDNGNRYRDYIDVVEADDILQASDTVPAPHRNYDAHVVSVVRIV